MREPVLGLAGESLTHRAALYAAGKLDAAQSAAFEELLGTSAAARDALGQAVRRALTGERQALCPDPAYRRRVRRRLRRARGGRLVVHAAVATLLLCVGALPEGQDTGALRRLRSSRAEAGAELGVARYYAELSNPEASHLARSWQELQPHPAAAVVLADARNDAHPWALLNDTTHLARVHEEFLKRRTEGARRREATPPGSVPSFRKHL